LEVVDMESCAEFNAGMLQDALAGDRKKE